MQDTVKVGDKDITIARFRGLKAVLAMDLMARVMREIPEIQERIDAYINEYRTNHTVKVTVGMAKLPRFAVLGLTAEDFQANSGQPIEFPDDPNGQQILVAMVPEFLTLARLEFVRFLALIAIPNSDLEEADDGDRVEAALDDLGKKLLRQGDVDQLLELAVVGWDVMDDQIRSKQARLGKLMDLPFLRTLRSTFQSQEEPEDETPATLPEDVPTSSTSSEADTDGIEGPLSMESLGTS